LQVRLWDARGKPLCPPLPGTDAPLLGAAFSADGKVLLTASADHATRLWDADAGKPLGPARHNEMPVTAVALRAHGKAYLTDTAFSLTLWDAASGKALPPADPFGLARRVIGGGGGWGRVPGSEVTGGTARQTLAFLPGGKAYLTTGPRGAVLRWDERT